ncbi:MAG: hypothetical protein EA345_06770 [Halomonas sp.]|nr:hypothetical protein [Halomonas sp.]TVP49361.1 MAG: hypothetical protein EA345_06770 [Halomonas sp.]
MSFKPTPIWLTAIVAPFLAMPVYAADAILTLPNESTVGVEVVETLRFESNQERLDDILLHPTQVEGASHSLPEYCVIIGTAQLNNERIRITTQNATCIETHETDSNIFSGDFIASAYAEDGQYAIACEGSPCTLAPGQSFMLTLNEAVEIEELDNPSAELNQRRREANGAGIANPIPREQPNPDAQ